MKLQRLYLISACAATLAATSANSSIIWTGAGADNNFWNASNWSGGAPVTGGGTTLDSIVMNGALGVTGAGQSLTLGDSYSLSLVNSTLNFTDGSGIGGLTGGSVNSITFDNSTVTVQFLSTGVGAGLLNNSSLNLKGAGRGINSQLESSWVTLAPGSSVTFVNGSNDPAGTTPASPTDQSNGLNIFNAVTGQSYAADVLSSPLTDFLVTGLDLTPFGLLGGGNGANGGAFTITAVPEPSVLALGGLGLVLIMTSRFRKV